VLPTCQTSSSAVLKPQGIIDNHSCQPVTENNYILKLEGTKLQRSKCNKLVSIKNQLRAEKHVYFFVTRLSHCWLGQKKDAGPIKNDACGAH